MSLGEVSQVQWRGQFEHQPSPLPQRNGFSFSTRYIECNIKKLYDLLKLKSTYKDHCSNKNNKFINFKTENKYKQNFKNAFSNSIKKPYLIGTLAAAFLIDQANDDTKEKTIEEELLDACSNRDYEKIKNLILNGVNVNTIHICKISPMNDFESYTSYKSTNEYLIEIEYSALNLLLHKGSLSREDRPKMFRINNAIYNPWN